MRKSTRMETLWVNKKCSMNEFFFHQFQDVVLIFINKKKLTINIIDHHSFIHSFHFNGSSKRENLFSGYCHLLPKYISSPITNCPIFNKTENPHGKWINIKIIPIKIYRNGNKTWSYKAIKNRPIKWTHYLYIFDSANMYAEKNKSNQK